MTSGISADGLVKVYEALGVKPEGKVAVKISTDEPGGHNFLQLAAHRAHQQQTRHTHR